MIQALTGIDINNNNKKKKKKKKTHPLKGNKRRQKQLCPLLPAKSIMESAGAAQCQEESERNPWFLHSAAVGGWRGGGCRKADRARLLILSQRRPR